ncbi:MAG: 30S ribosomal protein S20 [Pseudomonadota bacterium]
MANHKQAIKRHKQNETRRVRNRAVVSNLRGLVKKARTSIAAGAPGDKSVTEASQAFDRAVTKGAMHKRTASRRVSRLMKAANRAKSK